MHNRVLLFENAIYTHISSARDTILPAREKEKENEEYLYDPTAK